MTNVGIIGYGKMGKIRAKAIQATGRGTIVSIYEKDHAIETVGFTRAGSVEEVLRNAQIETVFICTPNAFNKRFTIEGLRNSKHVFCEKPPAFNAKDIEEIRRVEGRSKKKLMYGFNHRHHGSIKQMKSFVDSGQYGKMLWMRGRYGKSVDENFFHEWRAKKEMAGGGILLDQGIHMLDLFLHMAGDFDDVHAFVSNLYWNLDIEDNVFAILRNNSTGVVASLHSTMTQWRHIFSFEIFMEKGYMVLNGIKTPSGTYGDEVLSIAKNRTTAPAATWEDEERITFTADTSWRSEVDAFFDAIEKDSPVTTGNSADALKLMKMVDRIYLNQ